MKPLRVGDRYQGIKTLRVHKIRALEGSSVVLENSAGDMAEVSPGELRENYVRLEPPKVGQRYRNAGAEYIVSEVGPDTAMLSRDGSTRAAPCMVSLNSFHLYGNYELIEDAPEKISLTLESVAVSEAPADPGHPAKGDRYVRRSGGGQPLTVHTVVAGFGGNVHTFSVDVGSVFGLAEFRRDFVRLNDPAPGFPPNHEVEELGKRLRAVEAERDDYKRRCYPETGQRDTELEQHKADKDAAVQKYNEVAAHRDRLLEEVWELHDENRELRGRNSALDEANCALNDDRKKWQADLERSEEIHANNARALRRQLEESQRDREHQEITIRELQGKIDELRSQSYTEVARTPGMRGGYQRCGYLIGAIEQAIVDLKAAADTAAGPISEVRKAVEEQDGRLA